MKDISKISQSRKYINPKQVIWIAVLLAILIISSAIFDFFQSKSDLIQLMEEQASTISWTIRMSSIWNMTASNKIEDLVAERLLAAARNVKRLDSLNILDGIILQKIAAENNLFRINIFDIKGNRLMSNVEIDSADRTMKQDQIRLDYIGPILNGTKDELIIGLKEARHISGKRFAVAVRRSLNKPGVIVVNVDAAYMVEFREKMGLQKMVNDMSRDSGVGFIIIQDENGILASNRKIENPGPLQTDILLRNVYNNGKSEIRFYNDGNEDYFESVSVLNIDDLPKSLLRIGLKTDELRSLEGMMIKRGAIVSLVLIIIGVIVITFTSTSQSLKTVENQYKRISTFSGSILENMADGVITTTMDGKIKIFNRSAEQILNIKEIDALEKELSEIPVLRDLPPVIASSLKNKTPIKYSEYKITINGSEEILGVSSTFTKNTLNEYDSFTVVFRNMTKIRRMEETAKQNEKLNAMGELAGKVAHEIRNPLNAISMIAQRFKREFKPAGKIEEYDLLNEVLLTETKRVNGIIEQFLKYAKPQRPVFSKVPARKFIEEIRLIAESVCKPKKVLFKVSEVKDTEIMIDKGLIKQLLLNLIFNALESVEEKGQIELKFEAGTDKKIIFILKDNGRGISNNDIKHIFDIYFTKKIDGMGLGLSIARQIAEQHGGTISASSTPGKQTIFKVQIPVKKESQT